MVRMPTKLERMTVMTTMVPLRLPGQVSMVLDLWPAAHRRREEWRGSPGGLKPVPRGRRNQLWRVLDTEGSGRRGRS